MPKKHFESDTDFADFFWGRESDDLSGVPDYYPGGSFSLRSAETDYPCTCCGITIRKGRQYWNKSTRSLSHERLCFDCGSEIGI